MSIERQSTQSETRADIVAPADASIAIVGMDGRFPGAANLAEFWLNLRDGVESISFFSEDELRASGVAEEALKDARYVRAGGVLEDSDLFDAAFFGFSPREAEVMDPQHRLFLECAWHALEEAGYDPNSYDGPIGVFAGAAINTYLLTNIFPARHLLKLASDFQLLIDNDKDFLPTRVSYKLNLKGPSINVNTACSTSLVVVHLACQSLLNGECDMALAGGVTVKSPRRSGYFYEEGGIWSPDGHCRAFDANAGGTIDGSGVGVILLKRLGDALRDGDNIRAIIKGSAINNDGSAKVGYTAPSVDGQAAVIADALAFAGLSPDSISYVEAHGTGTSLGDPVEVAALTQAFRDGGTERRGFCRLGSVKSNVGHLGAAAGMAGLIKTVLAMEHKMLPPSLHYRAPNSQIDFASSPFYVNSQLSEWKTQDSEPLRAGVSSFGIGGTNAHVILEEAPAASKVADAPARKWQTLIWSAQSEAALERVGRRLLEYLEGPGRIADLADIAFTLQTARRGFTWRRALISRDVQDAARSLRSALGLPAASSANAAAQESGETSGAASILDTRQVAASRAAVAFLFPGQGAHYQGMGAALYRTSEAYRAAFDYCSEKLSGTLGCDLRELLYGATSPGSSDEGTRAPSSSSSGERASKLDETWLTQPALFAVEYALCEQWRAWGVRPSAVAGHSLGELAAACAAGVFSLEDGLQLALARGRVMERAGAGGAMLAVLEKESRVRQWAEEAGLDVAAVNAERVVVVSGERRRIAGLERRMSEIGVACKRISAYAFHSKLMKGAASEFEREASSALLRGPEVRVASGMTGTWLKGEEACAAGYWSRQLQAEVRWRDCVETIGNAVGPCGVLLEVGPGCVLSKLSKQHPVVTNAQDVVIPSLSNERSGRAQSPDDEEEALALAIGQLWQAGVEIDWRAYWGAERRRRLSLPTYPFERQRHWLEPSARQPQSRQSETTHAEQEAQQASASEHFYAPSWKRTPLPFNRDGQLKRESRCLVFADDEALSSAILGLLEESGVEVVTVKEGEQFVKVGAKQYALNPREGRDYDALLEDLRSQEKFPQELIHLWSTGVGSERQARCEDFAAQLHAGLQSLFLLAQALGKNESTRDLRIGVVSSSVYDVTGSEDLCLTKAVVPALCKIISGESAHIKCRSIDLDAGASATAQVEKQARQVVSEMAAEIYAPFVAYRGAHRWVQVFEPMQFDGASANGTKMHGEHVYALAGELTNASLTLAKHLRTNGNTKVALIGKRETLRQQSREGMSSSAMMAGRGVEQDNGNGASESGLSIEAVEANRLSRAEERIEKELDIKGIGSYEGLTELGNELCASYVYDYLQTGGIDTSKGKTYRLDELKKMFRVVPQLEKFFEHLLGVLAEDGVVQRDGDRIEFLKGREGIKNSRGLKEAVVENYPAFGGFFHLLEHCASNYSKALSGEVAPISVLYPNGNSEFMERCLKNTIDCRNHKVYLTLLKETLLKLAGEARGRKLRVLEIGGGTGEFTWAVAPELEKFGASKVEYYFTDIGKTFVIDAESKARRRGYDFMKFGAFDITKGPAAQGYDESTFDVVLGLDVVHTTKNIAATIVNLKKLLSSGGVLCLVETVRAERWTSMIWGLAEGWWYFDDERESSPFLSAERWEASLRRAGVEGVVAFPRDPQKRLTTDASLIVVPNATAQGATRHGLIQTSVDNGAAAHDTEGIWNADSGIAFIETETSDASQVSAALARVKEQWGAVSGLIYMTGEAANRSSLTELTPAEFEAQLRKRHEQLVALEESLEGTDASFCLLQSSLSVVNGESGAPLSNALASLTETFAQMRNRTSPIRWGVVNWDSRSFNSETLDDKTARPASVPSLKNTAGRNGNGTSGVALAELRDAKGAHAANENGHAALLYDICWQKKNIAAKDNWESSGRWLLLAQDEIGNEVSSLLRQQGQSVVSHLPLDVLAPSARETKEQRQTKSDFLLERLGAQAHQLTDVLFIWTGQQRDASRWADADALEAELEQSVYGLFHLCQAIVAGGMRQPLNLWLVTSRAHAVEDNGDEATDPVGASLWAFNTSLPHDLQNVSSYCIDINADENAATDVAALIVGEMKAGTGETQVAYRRQERYVPVVVSLNGAAAGETLPLRRDGVYLITGGTSGLGLEVGKWLSKRTQGKIILVGRSEPIAREGWDDWLESHASNERAAVCIRAIREMETNGAQVFWQSADVSHAFALKAVWDDAVSRFGSVNGIVHAAGVLPDSRFPSWDFEGFRKILAPKVQGTWALDQLAIEQPTDFKVLFSSIAAVFGGTGLTEHATASAFMHACARMRGQADKGWQSILWSEWAEIGSAHRYRERAGANASQEADKLIQRLSTEEGLRAFEQALTSPARSIIVAKMTNRNGDSTPLEGLLKAHRTLGGEQSKRTSAKAAAGTAIDEAALQIAEIWAEAFGVQHVTPDSDFFELGGDSLLGVRIVALVRDRLQLQVSIKDIYEHSTPNKLAALGASRSAKAEATEAVASLRRREPPLAEFELSYAQRPFFVHDLLKTENGFSHVPVGVMWKGVLPEAIIEAAVRYLIARHAALRIVFDATSETPKQRVLDKIDFRIKTTHIVDAATKEETQRCLLEHLREDYQVPFDVTTGPLIRGQVFHLPHDEQVLYINMHHLVADGWTIVTLAEEFAQICTALLRGAALDLPQPGVEYADYVEWQQESASGGEWRAHEEYWLRQMHEPPASLDLPRDRQSAGSPRFAGESVSAILDAETSAAVRAFAREQSVTVYNVLFAAYATLLHRLSAADDLIVGMPVAGRNASALHRVVGCFINVLPIRLNFDEDDTLLSVLRRVHSKVMESFEHEDYPFSLLLEKLRLNRQNLYRPLFSTVFLLENPIPDLYINGVKASYFEMDAFGNNSKADLFWKCREAGEHIRCDLNYDSALFERETAQRFLSQFEQTLNALCRDAAQSIYGFDLS